MPRFDRALDGSGSFPNAFPGQKEKDSPPFVNRFLPVVSQYRLDPPARSAVRPASCDLEGWIVEGSVFQHGNKHTQPAVGDST
jgi:hypothetical protein